MSLHQVTTVPQITFVQPPPAGSVSQVIPNQAVQNVVQVQSSVLDNPGTNQPPTTDSFPYGLSDVYSINQNLSQFFPINSPPNP